MSHPAGTSQAPAAAPTRVVDIVADATPEIVIDPGLCKKCGICVTVCPADVFDPGPDGLPRIAHLNVCIWCVRCEIYCPDYAIRLRGRRGW